MTTRLVRLIDENGSVLATADVLDRGDHYAGTIDLRATPSGIRALFEEFEAVVNGQMFAFLDGVQDKIAALAVRAVFADGSEFAATDLQVFPAAAGVSFRVAGTDRIPPAVTQASVRSNGYRPTTASAAFPTAD